MRKLQKMHPGKKITHDIAEVMGAVTTAEAKAAERAHLYRYYQETGKVPPGNRKSFKP
jgi:hypothetical protein